MLNVIVISVILFLLTVISLVFLLRFFLENQRNFHPFNRRKMVGLMIDHLYYTFLVPFVFQYETPKQILKLVGVFCGGIVSIFFFIEFVNLFVDRKHALKKVVNQLGLDPMNRIYLSLWLDFYSQLFTVCSVLFTMVIILSCTVQVREDRIAARRSTFIQQSIRIHKFDPATDTENKNCPICLSDYEAGQQLAQTNCHHSFHNECLRGWLDEKNSCPMCREEFF